MKKLQVEMTSPSKGGKCSAQRMCLGMLVFLVVGILGMVSYLSLKAIEHDSEIDSIKRENQFNLRELNETKFSMKELMVALRLYTDNRTSNNPKTADDNSHNTALPKIGPELNASFKHMKERLNVVISMIGNLSENVLRMNRSSDSKIGRLRSNLKDARYDLIRLGNVMTALNNTVHRKLFNLIVSSVKDVRQDLDALRISTVTNITDLWKHWNRTDQAIEDVIKLITRQNETLHFKIAYHSDILYSKVKDIEKQQSKFHKETKTSLDRLRSNLNNTRDILQLNFHNKISKANSSWHNELQVLKVSIASVRSSVADLSRKVFTVQKDFQTKINDIQTKQKQTKKDFEEINKDYQENDRKHDSAISKQKTETERLKERIASLERGKILNSLNEAQQNKKMRDMTKRIEELENGANAMAESNTQFIVLTFFLALSYNYLN